MTILPPNTLLQVHKWIFGNLIFPENWSSTTALSLGLSCLTSRRPKGGNTTSSCSTQTRIIGWMEDLFREVEIPSNTPNLLGHKSSKRFSSFNIRLQPRLPVRNRHLTTRIAKELFSLSSQPNKKQKIKISEKYQNGSMDGPLDATAAAFFGKTLLLGHCTILFVQFVDTGLFVFFSRRRNTSRLSLTATEALSQSILQSNFWKTFNGEFLRSGTNTAKLIFAVT